MPNFTTLRARNLLKKGYKGFPSRINNVPSKIIIFRVGVDYVSILLRVPITQRKYLFRNYTTNHTTPADRFTTGTTMQC
jgi:hypothetical protein